MAEDEKIVSGSKKAEAEQRFYDYYKRLAEEGKLSLEDKEQWEQAQKLKAERKVE